MGTAEKTPFWGGEGRGGGGAINHSINIRYLVEFPKYFVAR